MNTIHLHDTQAMAADEDETFSGPIWPAPSPATQAQRQAYQAATDEFEITPVELLCYAVTMVVVLIASCAGWLP